MYNNTKKCNTNNYIRTTFTNTPCCSDYNETSDWKNSFNIRTLEQFEKSINVKINGMNFNINDAKNVIGQAEQYIAIIYELLIACIDQILKVTALSGNCDYDSASLKIKEYLNEIYLIVGNVQYNGNHLLQDTTGLLRGMDDTNFQAGPNVYPNNFPQACTPYVSLDLSTPDTTTISSDNNNTTIIIESNISNSQLLTDIQSIKNTFDSNVSNNHIVNSDSFDGFTNIDNIIISEPDYSSIVTITITLSDVVTIQDNSILSFILLDSCQVDYSIITDKIVYNDTIERDVLNFRLTYSFAFCQNTDQTNNDFVYKLPAVGVHSLGLTSFTSKDGQDYFKMGLEGWKNENEEYEFTKIDETIIDFNCAIKKIGIQLDKLRAYRRILCLKEKQIKIYKNGLENGLEIKKKM
jgi:hypothetical protein